MEKKKKRWFTIPVISILVLILLIAALIRWRITAIEAAIIQFVSIKTNGEYSLTIGGSHIDFQNVELDFTKVHLKRNTTQKNKKGIRSLEIPHVHIAFSNYKVLFNTDSLEIRKLTIDEPIIEIEKGLGKKSQVKENLAGNLVKLYPATKAFLDHYRVHELNIKKGGFSITKDSANLVKVGLIDFYLYEWNVPNLSDKSQLHLRLGKQAFQHDRSGFGFEEISYSFKQKYIQISEFHFSTQDSAHQASISVKGKSIKLDSIDYGQLLDYQRYKISSLKIVEPKIDLSFSISPSGKSSKRKTIDRSAITSILKNTVGEFIVDSTQIEQAQLNLAVARNNDTLKIELPNVSIGFSDFIVLNDSSEYYIENMSVNLPNTKIKLFNNFILSCDQFSLDRFNDIYIGNARIFSGKSKTEFVYCQKIKLNNFDVAQFAFTKELEANDITFYKADVNLTPELVNQIKHPTAAGKSKHGPPPISLQLFQMKDVNIHFTDKKHSIHILNAECDTRQIHNKYDSIAYTLKLLAAEKLIYSSADSMRRSVLNGFRHENKWIYAESFHHTDENIRFQVNGFSIYPVVLSKTNDWIKHPDTVRVENLEFHGHLAVDTNAKKNDLPLTIQHLSIGHIVLDVRIQQHRLYSAGKDLTIKQFDLQKNVLPFHQITGHVYRFRFNDQHIHCATDSMLLDMQGVSRIYMPRLKSKDIYIQSEFLTIKNIEDSRDFIQLGNITSYKTWAEKKNTLILESDSIRIDKSIFGGSASTSIQKISLFNNTVSLLDTTKNEKKEFNPAQLFAVKQMGPAKEVFLNSVKILAHNREPAYVKGIRVTAGKEYATLHVDSIFYKTPKMYAYATKFSGSYDHLHLGTLRFKPDPVVLANLKRETDVIDVKFTDIRLVDEKNPHVAGLDILEVGDFKVRIKKDKYLPDNEYSEKPFLLDVLIDPLKKTNLKEVRIKNGMLEYLEISDKSGWEAQVDLTSIDIHLHKIQEKHQLQLKGKAKLYDQGVLEFQYETKDSTLFELQAEVQNLNLPLLNQVIMPMEQVEITSGKLDRMQFQMQGRDDKSNGKTILSYRKLRLHIYDKKKGGQRTFKSSLISFVANVFVLKKKQKERSSLFEMPRERDASVFGYWVKSALTGALQTLKHGKKEKKKTN